MSNLVGDAWHLSPSAQEALRLRAMAALVAGGTVRTWRRSFRYVLNENPMSWIQILKMRL